MKAFLSGPVTALPRSIAEYNFNLASDIIEKCWEKSDEDEDLVMFVPTISIPADYDHKTAMTVALTVLLEDDWDFLISIPGYKKSQGALLERAVADAVGIPTIDLENFISLHFDVDV